jgi:hypothetical protein
MTRIHWPTPIKRSLWSSARARKHGWSWRAAVFGSRLRGSRLAGPNLDGD